uniref:Uncharacterized protein n=1 Tax=Bartonella schoenbuchensis (strain DSM 13525 / NCTC 13165 / R1) TaxID=687861 RepID=E6YYS0_BARSR|nr:conserved hypothetical protein [Bartonella schoenbuchensis R1]
MWKIVYIQSFCRDLKGKSRYVNNALEVDLSLVTKALAKNKPLKIY